MELQELGKGRSMYDLKSASLSAESVCLIGKGDQSTNEYGFSPVNYFKSNEKLVLAPTVRGFDSRCVRYSRE